MPRLIRRLMPPIRSTIALDLEVDVRVPEVSSLLEEAVDVVALRSATVRTS